MYTVLARHSRAFLRFPKPTLCHKKRVISHFSALRTDVQPSVGTSDAIAPLTLLETDQDIEANYVQVKNPIDLTGLTEDELFALRDQLRLYTSENPDPSSPQRFNAPPPFTRPNSFARSRLRTLTYDELHALDYELCALTDSPLPETIPEEVYAATQFAGRGMFPAHHHPKTHGVPIASVQFRSYTIHPMDLYLHFVTHAAAGLGMPVSRVVSLPTERTLWTVIKSPFIYKKTQENFERLTHKRVIKVWDTQPEVFERWLKYIREHAVPGVGIRVTRWERVAVGVGKKLKADTEQRIAGKGRTDAAKVLALADAIVEREMEALKKTETPAPAAKSDNNVTAHLKTSNPEAAEATPMVVTTTPSDASVEAVVSPESESTSKPNIEASTEISHPETKSPTPEPVMSAQSGTPVENDVVLTVQASDSSVDPQPSGSSTATKSEEPLHVQREVAAEQQLQLNAQPTVNDEVAEVLHVTAAESVEDVAASLGASNSSLESLDSPMVERSVEAVLKEETAKDLDSQRPSSNDK